VLLHDNLRALKDIASHEARVPKKAEFARAFDAWIEGALAAGEQGKAAQDDILVTNMLWAIDYRDFDYALCLAAHAIRYHLVLPGFTRSVACIVAEEIAGIAWPKRGRPARHAPAHARIGHGSDMPDPVMAKLYKASAAASRARPTPSIRPPTMPRLAARPPTSRLRSPRCPVPSFSTATSA
jgi:hypothetical protein